jgi:hypothetical protein
MRTQAELYKCFAPGCDEVASLGVRVTEFDFDITFELCGKHSETLAPELMRLYNITRLVNKMVGGISLFRSIESKWY